MSISVQNVSKSYGAKQALDGVSFEVAPGEVFGLLGANGSGKTTLNRCIATLLRPDTGRIVVDGQDAVEAPDAVRQRIGYLAEFPTFYPSLSADEFLRFLGGLQGLSEATATERIDRWITLFELEEARRLPLGGFSQGMKRKIALAGALIGDPSVVLLDEPTNGLDPPSVYLFRQVINSLREQGRTVLLSSHVLPLVEQACDRVAILAGGTLKVVGTMTELREDAGMPDADLEQLFLHYSGLDEAMLERLAVSTRPSVPDAEDLAGSTWVPEQVLDGFGA
ncbi:MAG: ABC transporter ATP-binding protein, partial [Deltaproteobacteria bacterium]|nr:ABC transporter ATP-binding protein [Deltaproteobacteria bacterium]